MLNGNLSNITSPFFIAEIGVNHNNDMDLAVKLIDEAKRPGAMLQW